MSEVSTFTLLLVALVTTIPVLFLAVQMGAALLPARILAPVSP